jgi:hypothetical protein
MKLKSNVLRKVILKIKRAYNQMQTALRVIFLRINSIDITQRLKWDSTNIPPLRAYETEVTTSTLLA